MPHNTLGTIYCKIIDKNSNESLLKMIKIKQEQNYDTYQVSLENFISTEKGSSKISFLIIRDRIVTSSISTDILLAYDDFSAANKLYLMDELSEEISLMCKRIEEMTKMNIQLYQDIREVSTK